MGAMPAPGGLIKGPGLLEQMQSRMMPSPQSGGLLSEDDIKNARSQGLLGLGASLLANSGPRTAGERVGLMQSVGQGIQGGQQAYQGALQGAAGQKMQEQQYQAGQQQYQTGQIQQQLGGAELADRARALQQAQQLSGGRKAIVERFPMPREMGGMKEWIEQTYPHFAAINDEESMSRMSEMYKSQGNTAARAPQEIDLGNRVIIRDPTTGQVMSEYSKGAAPGQGGRRDPRPITLINPESGKAEVALFSPESGDFEFTGQTPATIGAGSEAERKNQAIYELSAPHVALLDEADAPSRIQQLARNGKLNEVLSSEQQRYDVSGRQLADGYLRLTTGAAYNKEELEQATIMMTPRPGDTPETIALKRGNRARLVRALRAAAGRSFQESIDVPMPGVQRGGGSTAPQAGGLRQRYGGLR